MGSEFVKMTSIRAAHLAAALGKLVWSNGIIRSNSLDTAIQKNQSEIVDLILKIVTPQFGQPYYYFTELCHFMKREDKKGML